MLACKWLFLRFAGGQRLPATEGICEANFEVRLARCFLLCFERLPAMRKCEAFWNARSSLLFVML